MEKPEILPQPIGQRILRYASQDDIAALSVLALILVDWQRVGMQGASLPTFGVCSYGLRRLMVRLQEPDPWYVGLITNRPVGDCRAARTRTNKGRPKAAFVRVD